MEIEIKNIAKNYRKKQVLKDINLTASGGSCIKPEITSDKVPSPPRHTIRSKAGA